MDPRVVVTGGAVAAGALGVLLYRQRFEAGGRHGPALSEGKALCSDSDYDANMAQLWGGPLPKYYYKCFDSWNLEFPPSDGGRGVALVTGGTGGIGFYVVKLMAKLGFEVIVPGRKGLELEEAGMTKAVLEAVPGAKIFVPTTKLDLGDFDSVRAFAAEVLAKYKRLDALCLNAGRGGAKGDPRDVTKDGHEAIMQVNATAHFLLTVLLMPLLEASPSARIVSQSSGARFEAKKDKFQDIDGTDASTFSAWDQYALSKAANALFTRAMNERLIAKGVNNVVALVVDPGFACTGVNFQHDLSKSMFGLASGFTRILHNLLGHHAADGALPMVLAAIDSAPLRNTWYTPKTASIFGPPVRMDPKKGGKPSKDPLNDDVYPKTIADAFWAQAAKHTSARL
eukprot:TRINITY_DN47337_c0_g1_i1.p1 TRINITY_DN47337_c0_g1~~TRINITY_DN47337_c0_g1_i1.p1  ORF type:complete len:397 (-),score=81.24 TRINITY_DN47337_c0_g1_i1:145-1335(-)